MNVKNLAVQTLQLKEKKTLKELIKELNLDVNLHAILVDGKRVSEDVLIDEQSKIIILPKIRGG